MGDNSELLEYNLMKAGPFSAWVPGTQNSARRIVNAQQKLIKWMSDFLFFLMDFFAFVKFGFAF